MEKTVLEGVVEEAYDTGNTWKSPQGRVFNIISVKIDVDGEILEGTTMSGKFKEGSKVSFTKEPDKYNDGKWKFKYESGYTGQSNGQTSAFQNNGKPNSDSTKGIEVGHAINNAVNMICAGIEFQDAEIGLSVEQKIEVYSEKIMNIAKRLKSK